LQVIQSQLAATSNIRNPAFLNQFRNGTGAGNGFNNAIHQTGQFRQEQMLLNTATEDYTKALKRGDVTLKEAINKRKLMNGVLQEQWRLQRMTTVNWAEKGVNGRMDVDALVPREAPERLGHLGRTMREVRNGTISLSQAINEQRMRLGTYATVVNNVGQNWINAGKNMQWAGRQLMVGLTVPFVAIGAAAGALAYQMDKEFTRVAKVYDYTVAETENLALAQKNLKKEAYATATGMAQAYGQSGKKTLEMMSELAASGKSGPELQETTEIVSKAAFLGELDRQEAIKATITLQNVYGMSNKKLAESFNYLNALENSTSLSMNDMVIAIPKLSGVVKSLGGDLQDIGTLMTASKVGGIDAAEGANALKAVLFRANAPVPGAEDSFIAATGKSLKDLIDMSKGDGIQLITEIGKALNAVSNPQVKTDILRDLFGIYQGSKAGIIMEQLALQTEQVAAANGVAGKSVEELAEIADRETRAMQESISGRFTRAFENVKIQLAQTGEPFLKIATKVLDFIGNIIERFNGLSDGNKMFIMITLAVVALIGPLIMIMGIIKNLVGQVVVAGSAFIKMVTGVRLVTSAEQAAKIAADAHTLSIRSQTAATTALNEQLKALALNLARASGQPLLGANGRPVPIPGAPVPMPRDPTTGRFISRAEQARRDQAIADREAARQARERQRSMAMTAGSTAMMVGMMGSMATSSSTWMNNMMQIVMYAGLFAAIMPGVITKMVTGFAAASRSIAIMTTTFIPGLLALGTLGPRLAAAGRMATAAFGPLAVITAGVAFTVYSINKSMRETRREQEKVNQSASNWATILQFTEREAGETANKAGDMVGTIEKKLIDFRKANKEATKDLEAFRNASADAQKDRAIQEGIKVKLAGGTKEQAEEATALALQIIRGEIGRKNFEAIMKVDVKGKFNFDNLTDMTDVALEEAERNLNAAFENRYDQGKRESFARFFTGNDDLNSRGGQQVKDQVKQLYAIFEQSNDEERPKVLNKIKDATQRDITGLYNGLSQARKEFLSSKGINNIDDLVGATKSGKLGDFRDQLGLSSKELDKFKRAADLATLSRKTFSGEAGFGDDASWGEMQANFGATTNQMVKTARQTIRKSQRQV